MPTERSGREEGEGEAHSRQPLDLPEMTERSLKRKMFSTLDCRYQMNPRRLEVFKQIARSRAFPLTGHGQRVCLPSVAG